jgi:hypothetical protein
LEQKEEMHIREITQYRGLIEMYNTKVDSLEQVAVKANNKALVSENNRNRLLKKNRELISQNENILNETITAIANGDTTVINNKRSEFRGHVPQG